MEKRRLGDSELAVTPLMLGGNVFSWTADEATSFAVLDAFVARGGNSIDTADVYSSWVPGHVGGESETVIGKWLKRSGRRNAVAIGTKVGMLATRQGLKSENLVAACDDSLRRLGVDAIDLYWIHKDDESTPVAAIVSALDDLVTAGKVRAVGASNFSPKRFAEALAESKRTERARFVAQQPEYNLMHRDIEAELVPLCARENVAILPYFSLASGFLTGKYRSAEDKSKSPRGGSMDRYLNAKGFAVLAALDAVAERHHATCAQVALAWLMAKPAIAAPIASARSVVQVEDLMGALDLKLEPADMRALDAASD
jgi:aryl-alcohol dehydrogenase-like predicted oxidoreductase